MLLISILSLSLSHTHTHTYTHTYSDIHKQKQMVIMKWVVENINMNDRIKHIKLGGKMSK